MEMFIVVNIHSFVRVDTKQWRLFSPQVIEKKLKQVNVALLTVILSTIRPTAQEERTASTTNSTEAAATAVSTAVLTKRWPHWRGRIL